MIPYWLLFGFFAAGALADRSWHERAPARSFAFPIAGLLVAVIVGLRYEVGADWTSYEEMFDQAERVSFSRALTFGDMGFQSLNWIVGWAGGDVIAVNVISAVIFTWGLFRLAKTQPSAWMAILVAVPYTIIVVAMGYTRQAVALGILMAGLASFLNGGSTARFALYVAAAALFHKTAVVAFPLVALAADRNRFINFLITISATFVLYDAFLSDQVGGFVERYIDREYSSQGAFVRIGMNMLAGLAFWAWHRRMRFSERESRLWRNFSWASVVLLILLLILPSSTAVDRIALYVLPLQIAILARLPLVMGEFSGKAAVLVYLAAVQFVWLNFAQYASYWIPYKWVLS